MLIPRKYNISERVIWSTIGVCVLPLLLNMTGIDFGTLTSKLDPYKITKFVEIESQQDIRDILLGRYFHTIFVSITISIAFLTAILTFIDFRIKGEVSTPIVGIALFCAGMLDTFHILVSTQVIHVPQDQFYLTSFTWFFCRLFHATVLIMGVSIFLVRADLFREESKKDARRFVIYIAAVFVLLTFATIIFLFTNSDTPRIIYPYRNIARPYDLIPLGLYLVSAFYIFPKFYEKHPSVFSKTLLLSLIPAIATQLYMAFGSNELFDNNFNIAHFMTAFSYFIPFVGLGLNYLQTHKNEQLVIGKLNEEAYERKRTEEILSGILNSSLSSIMGFKTIRNKHGEIEDFEWTLVNPASGKIFDFSDKVIVGRRLTDLLPFSKSENWLLMFKDVIETGIPLTYEYFSPHLHKWLLMIAVKLSPDKDNDSKEHDGLAVTISDISKRKNALKELMDSEKLTMTGRMAQTIAHEVRNPLTNINMSIEQLKDVLEKPDESVQTFLDIMQRNSHRINVLITELLNSSKPSQLEMKHYSINHLVDEALTLAKDRMQLKKLKLAKHFNDQIPSIMLDKEKMKTAFLNIIINAVEAMEEEKGVLSVRTKAAGSRCIVEIEDNGSGISKENLTNLFVPFFSKKSKGMGLGLFATQNIILTHKGNIDVESTVGKGTRFTISFETAS